LVGPQLATGIGLARSWHLLGAPGSLALLTALDK